MLLIGIASSFSPFFFGAADNEGLEFALFHSSLPQLHLTMQLQSSASFVWLRNVFSGMSDLRRQLFALFPSTGSLFSIKFRKDDKLGSLLSFGKPLSFFPFLLAFSQTINSNLAGLGSLRAPTNPMICFQQLNSSTVEWRKKIVEARKEKKRDVQRFQVFKSN